MSEIRRRLLGFVLVAAGVFALAYVIGERLPGHSHSGHAHALDLTSYQLSPEPDGGYTVRGIDGTAVTTFIEQHGAVVHVIATRPDFSVISHTHPKPSADGEIRLDLPDDGPWSVYAEVLPAGRSATAVARTDIGADRPYGRIPLAPPTTHSSTLADGERISVRRQEWTFMVDPTVSELQPFLGQPAHLVVLRTSDGAYQHLHPTASDGHSFTFDGSALGPGTYRAFLQFGYRGTVLTFPFTIEL